MYAFYLFIVLALDTSGLMSSAYNIKVKEHTQQDDMVADEEMDREDPDTTSNFFDPPSLIMKFSEVKNKLNNLMLSVDPKMIMDQCSFLLASKQANIPLFTTDFVDVLKGNCKTFALLHRIAPFANWSDHSIISTIVEFCNVPAATKLLTQFNAGIDPSQPLLKFPIPAPSHYMVPYDNSTHTVLAVQLETKLHNSTLQNVLDTRSLLQEQCSITSHCLQLLAIANTIHTIIYWSVPKHVVGLITSSTLQHQNYLHQNGIQQVAIYPGTVFVTGSPLTVGLFSFFTKVSFK